MNSVRTTTNAKGQFVIPVLMRKYWDISPTTSLEVISIPNSGILIKPSNQQADLTDEEFMDVLEATKGSMVNADWDETEKNLDKLGKQELKKMKTNAW